MCARWVRFFRNGGAPTYRALASACSPAPTTQLFSIRVWGSPPKPPSGFCSLFAVPRINTTLRNQALMSDWVRRAGQGRSTGGQEGAGGQEGRQGAGGRGPGGGGRGAGAGGRGQGQGAGGRGQGGQGAGQGRGEDELQPGPRSAVGFWGFRAL